MKSNDNIRLLFENINRKGISRRSFVARGAGCTACLSMLSFAGMRTEMPAAQVKKSDEEILKELEAKAARFMSTQGSCARSTFASLNEQFELKADAIVPAIMPFTGGIAGKGETCGAVSGAIFAIGLFFECIKQYEKKQFGTSMRLGGLFFDRFEKEFGSTRCREVVKHQYGRYLDLNKPEDIKIFMEESKKEAKCLQVVQKAAVIAGEIILANS
ncbi:MAG: C_GCAxxG_C_C family protein [Acidobacteria bacterium]|nr:C_GCAxxG_C_C family protein [Acidobacteriota bacterium]